MNKGKIIGIVLSSAFILSIIGGVSYAQLTAKPTNINSSTKSENAAITDISVQAPIKKEVPQVLHNEKEPTTPVEKIATEKKTDKKIVSSNQKKEPTPSTTSNISEEKTVEQQPVKKQPTEKKPVEKQSTEKVIHNAEKSTPEKSTTQKEEKEHTTAQKDTPSNSNNKTTNKNNTEEVSNQTGGISNNLSQKPQILWLGSPKILKGDSYSNSMLYLYAEPKGLKATYTGHVDTNKPGTYEIKVTVRNSKGQSDSKTTTVTILPRNEIGQVTSEAKDTNGNVLIPRHVTQSMPVGSTIKGYTPPSIRGYRVEKCYLNGRVADVGESADTEDTIMSKGGKHLVWIMKKY